MVDTKTPILNKLIFLLPAVLLFVGCTDDPLREEAIAPPHGADMSKFWYSRTRTVAENSVMMRHHALGFSYQAVSGSKCNAADVMCQIFNLDYLEENGLISTDTGMEQSGESYVERGVADIIHGAKWTTEISADLLLYKKDKVKAYELTESVRDSTIVMHNSIKLRREASSINVELMSDPKGTWRINEMYNFSRVYSDNFRYAVLKLEDNRENVAVIDSFLNIFGTHVVTGIEIGGKCDIAVKTSKRRVNTYLEEQEYSRDAINLFFKKKETIEKLSNQKNYVNLFRTAEIDLSVRGGDVSRFDRLVANPSYDNALASYNYFDEWCRSVAEAGDTWDEGTELIDMEVTPIYEFMPDEDLAKRVKVRMEASAQDMRDLYGELNFTNADLSIMNDYKNSIDYCPAGVKNPFGETGANGFLHIIPDASGMPSRIVAVTYHEYIPELKDSLFVTYPVYENRIQLEEGIGTTPLMGYYYSIKWLYDRFVTERLKVNPYYYEIKLYLYKGRLFVNPVKGETFRQTKRMPDYEWPGSLDINGNLTKENYYTVRKENDKFYLNAKTGEGGQTGEIQNLPGWTYNYKENGMVRNDNYRYKIMPKELKIR